MYLIGVDIGGTKISVGLVKNGRVERKIREPVKKDRKEFLKQVIDLINWCIKNIDKNKIKGIGIGVPGPADYRKGFVMNPPNLRQLWKFNIKNYVKSKTKLKVKVDNDVHVIAIAEKHFGQGKKLKNFVVLAIGTGIGGGIVIDGKHYEGIGNAGEIGASIIDDSKRKLAAYGDGSLEGLASGTAIMKMAKEWFGKELYATDLAKMAGKGNKKAKKVLEDAGMHLGVGLSNVINLYDPELVILAGGVRESGDYILNSARKEVKKLVKHKHCNIVWSKLEDPGVLGAAALFLEQ